MPRTNIPLQGGKFFYLAAILFLQISQGCAGTLNGPSQNVKINSNPGYARITVDTLPGKSFVAPATIPLDRSKNHIITVETPGHEKIRTRITSRTDSKAVALDCLWLCIPLLVDVPKGATKELSPEMIHVRLPKK